MSTKENNPGLLSKVAKFVRNPTTNWTDLDKETEQDKGYSKQALKEMIERKRQNDFVRKREFDQLRKLRRRDPNTGNGDRAGRPSYFPSSLSSNTDERKMTIKKIDEIEAQMSNQWWQGKKDGAKPALAPSDTGGAAADASQISADAGAQEDRAYAATRLAPMHGSADHADFVPTQTISAFGRDAGPTLPPPAGLARRAETVVVPAFARAAGMAGFSESRPIAMDPLDGLGDPDLEEASIRFANGDNAGAEEGLLAALNSRKPTPEMAEAWTAALFDLYRATGQQARFDAVAIDYAERFGRSAPSWFSMSEALGIPSATALVRTMPSQLMDEPLWSSPALFDLAAADTLRLAIANAASPWFLDWSAIESIAAQAFEALGEVFEEWTTTAVQLRFRGSASLERALRAATPSGAKSAGQAPWRLRMNALRVMQMQDEFELVALDYCVTFEVSPPPWHDALCHFHRQFEGSAPGASALEVHEAPAEDEDQHPMTIPMGFEEVPSMEVELSGEILGEATDALARLEQAREGSERLVISCANLIRVDFSAAGSILNWVALRQAEGCHLQFRDVHRLVAAFFNVIGINEHARVVLRSN